MADMKAIGEEIVKEIQKEIIRMELFVMGHYFDSIKYRIQGRKLIIYSEVKYAEPLEYGSYDLGRLTQNIMPNQSAATAKGFKKKDLPRNVAKLMPRGMVAFAPMRRVIYNEKLIGSIIERHS